MKILRWTLRLHKWIALLVGLQIFIWVGTGIYFSLFPIEEIRGNHKKTEWTVQPFDTDRIIPLHKAVENTGTKSVKSAELGHMMGRPVWRLVVPDEAHGDHGKIITVDGRSGRVLSPIAKPLAIQIAKSDYAGDGVFSSIEYLNKTPSEAGGGAGPIWAAQFNDKEKTTLYIDPNAAKVTKSRSTRWRLFDFFFKLHVMDYDDGEDFDSLHLKVISMIAMLVVLSGFTLLFIRLRRMFLTRRARNQEDF